MYRAVRFLFPFLFSVTFCFPILVLHYGATVESLPNITNPFETHTYFTRHSLDSLGQVISRAQRSRRRPPARRTQDRRTSRPSQKGRDQELCRLNASSHKNLCTCISRMVKNE